MEHYVGLDVSLKLTALVLGSRASLAAQSNGPPSATRSF